MPVRGNQFRNTNSFREEPKFKSAPRQRDSRDKTEALPNFRFTDGRVIKIIGLSL